MPSHPRPPSMKDVAAAAGVHQTTVSLALRNDTRLSEKTRSRIQRIAREMNYRPHPLVSALISLRRSRKERRFHDTIAFVVGARHPGSPYEQYLAGARSVAEEYGYKVDLFALGAGDLSEQRLNSILRARNVHGLIVGPLPQARGDFSLDWDRYCTVVIEYTFTGPPFDRLVHDHYAGMRRIMVECRLRKIRRVGLFLSTNGHERTEQLNGAAYWVEQKHDTFFAAIPPLILPAWHPASLASWCRRYRPDAIVTSRLYLDLVQEWVDQRGAATMQFFNVNAAPEGAVAGICQNPFVLGGTAARLVIAKMIRNDRGIPANPHTTITRGTWLEGSPSLSAPGPRPMPGSP